MKIIYENDNENASVMYKPLQIKTEGPIDRLLK